MSRPTSNPTGPHEPVTFRNISSGEIEAAIREGRRLRAEAFGHWLRAGNAALRGYAAGVALRMRRRRVAG
ncbi:hypothetical protein H0I76_15975 [Limibaculum sp. M0105]|uniref:Uncharacterized protein n=1 Tax=Thermohalobaculum xanthum TaxID=2753746 RepID=A0A8J7SEJ4_9RHOB|nr:hypothetical protein [Thermohalobaculum xanthum]MBK0400697.1 hypothetical protein [Thermohalobaculum xanthum]